jgi:hypothetical protein
VTAVKGNTPKLKIITFSPLGIGAKKPGSVGSAVRVMNIDNLSVL